MDIQSAVQENTFSHCTKLVSQKQLSFTFHSHNLQIYVIRLSIIFFLVKTLSSLFITAGRTKNRQHVTRLFLAQ